MRPETELKKISTRIESDIARRDELILTLRTQGWSLAEIAGHARLTRSGVANVLRKHNWTYEKHPEGWSSVLGKPTVTC